MLPIVLSSDKTDYLFEKAFNEQIYMLDINLDEQTIKDDLGWSANFEIDQYKKKSLLEGLDDILITLQLKDKIDQFEKHYQL